MSELRFATDRRRRFDRCHVRMTYLMLMTSASVMVCCGNNATSFKSIRKISLMPIDFRPDKKFSQLYQVARLKAQILRGLNLTSVPEPPTKKPPQPNRVHNHVTIPPDNAHKTPSAIVWSEPFDMRKKMADRMLFRVSNPRKQSASIYRVSLLLRLRSSRHSKRRHRKRSRAKKGRLKFPDLKGKEVQSDQQKRGSKKQPRATRKKKSKSKSRRKKSRRVKVLVQSMTGESGKFKRVAVQRVVVDKKFHWINLAIPASVVSRAIQSINQSLVLRVRCKRCHKGGVSIDSPVPRKKRRHTDVGSSSSPALNPHRPYLIIFATKTPPGSGTTAAPSRSARHVGSVYPGPTDDSMPCCADRLHVTFRDLGWDHWIVDPEGFTTVLCRGVCQQPSDLGASPLEERPTSKEVSNDQRLFTYDRHAWPLKRNEGGASFVDGARDSSNADTRETGGCQPQNRSSLTVMYYTDHNTLTRAVIPELLTNSCSCMKK
ncbi:uncharacterized protein LOC143274661 [Babylonia areolata]|uniref:uncharacterized protein LOC143274661 n=1 Tax=Babylonia areolata TaxID=304850 RepID=UPI003FD33AE5